jgi:hypothetical protein
MVILLFSFSRSGSKVSYRYSDLDSKHVSFTMLFYLHKKLKCLKNSAKSGNAPQIWIKDANVQIRIPEPLLT